MHKSEVGAEKDVARHLARGLVLYERKISATGSTKTQYILMRPVIEDGLIIRLDEDAETTEANAAPGKKYGIRAKDVDATMLEEIAPGVYWFSSRALDRANRAGQSILSDPRRRLSPLAGLVRPEALDRPMSNIPLIADQLAEAQKSESASDALSCLLDGQHLVKREIEIDGKAGPSNRIYWRPMFPNGDPERPGSYEQNIVSTRYTEWAGRPYGFTQETVDSIATLLKRVDFDPDDPRAGPAYALNDQASREDIAKLIGWSPLELHKDILHAAMLAIEEAEAESITLREDRGLLPQQLRRQQNIVSMMEGHMLDPVSSLGPAPGMDEVAHALVAEILTTRDEERSKRLVEAALKRALSARTSIGFWDRLWNFLGKS